MPLGPIDEAALATRPLGAVPCAPAVPVGRYTKAQQSFNDTVQAAQLGDKYNLDDEIVAVRAQLSLLQEQFASILPGIAEDKSNMAAASVLCRQFEALIKRLTDLLTLAAKLEGQVSIFRVRAWAANLMRIIREESKDDSLCQRISRRLGSSVI